MFLVLSSISLAKLILLPFLFVSTLLVCWRLKYVHNFQIQAMEKVRDRAMSDINLGKPCINMCKMFENESLVKMAFDIRKWKFKHFYPNL